MKENSVNVMYILVLATHNGAQANYANNINITVHLINGHKNKMRHKCM
jgi:hypothetical protein